MKLETTGRGAQEAEGGETTGAGELCVVYLDVVLKEAFQEATAVFSEGGVASKDDEVIKPGTSTPLY